jgi:hypothetical protein
MQQQLTQTERHGLAMVHAVSEMRAEDDGPGQYQIRPTEGSDWTRLVYDWPEQSASPVGRLDLDEGVAEPHPVGRKRHPDALKRLSDAMGPLRCPYCRGDGELYERPVSASRGCEPDAELVPCDGCGGTGDIEAD